MIQLARTLAIAAALSAGVGPIATAQRPRSGGGVMGGTPGTVSQPPRPSAGSPSSRGTISVPRGPSAASPRSGGVPRIVTQPARRPGSRPAYMGGGINNRSTGGSTYGTSTYGTGSYGSYPRGSTRYRRPPYSRWGVGAGCAYGCFRLGAGVRTGSFFGSFYFGYPFAVPIYLPYIVETTTYVRHDEPAYDSYDTRADLPAEPGRAASKLIVVGGGTGGGDALTVETLGDSVRLSWLAAGRSAREVKLFVADSARRELAARTASPSAPVATFEIVTLSAPVAFAGVSVTFTDGVTTTTVVPYQHAGSARR